MNFISYFSQNLIYLLSLKHKTSRDLAAYLEVAPSTISGYRKGIQKPTILSLLKISSYFNVTLDQLVAVDLEKSGFTYSNQNKSSESVNLLVDPQPEYIVAQKNTNNSFKILLDAALEQIETNKEEIQKLKMRILGIEQRNP